MTRSHLARRLAAPAVAAAALLCAPAAHASAPRFRVVLPGDAAAAGVRAQPGTWIVGARPGATGVGVAKRFGARRIATGSWLVARDRARALAAALRRAGALVYAEPNSYKRSAQGPAPDPLSSQAAWRDYVADPSLAPPPVTPESPLLVLVDSQIDLSHPEFAGGNVSTAGGQALGNEHGTATAAVAAAPANGVGILGIWPGMRALNQPLPAEGITCADSAAGIHAAVEAGAAVINMSYGSTAPCNAEFVELQLATGRRVTLVAAAGNEFAEGNPLEFPASLPHVLTVAAVGADLRSALFSNASEAMDLSAPGVGILTAVPLQFDQDGTVDGYTPLSGTSFAAPMVAAAAAWVRAARPDLTSDQVANVLRLSARDIENQGWDQTTGFGLVSIAGALQQEAPPVDPLEPNDDIAWIDGRAFGRADRTIWRGGRSGSLFGLLDKFEDPDDVYRVSFPARSRVKLTVKPRFGDPDLRVYDRRADSITDDGELLGVSHRNGRRTDTLTVRNTGRRARIGYVRVYIDREAQGLDSGYTLSITRLKKRR